MFLFGWLWFGVLLLLFVFHDRSVIAVRRYGDFFFKFDFCCCFSMTDLLFLLESKAYCILKGYT